MIQVIKKSIMYVLEMLLTLLCIVSIIAFSKSYSSFPSLEGLQLFINTCQEILTNLFSLQNLNAPINDTIIEPYIEAVKEPYLYSLIVLFGGFLFSFFMATCISYICHLLPSRIQKGIKSIMFFIESIPDVVFIFSIQLIIIWLFKVTGVLIVDPIAGFDNVYVLPILTISILPSIMLFQIIMLSFEEEETKLYVEFARAKGFSKQYIFMKHMFRNVFMTVLSNSQYLFWFMLSNLLMAEYMFNMHGIFRFLRNSLFDDPSIFAITLILLFIPFYFLDLVGKWIIAYITGEEK